MSIYVPPFNRARPASLNTTPVVSPTNSFNMGQIVGLIFQQPYSISATEFATLAAAQTLATWVTNLAAADVTAMFATSTLFGNSKITNGKVLQSSADSNTTVLGQPEYYGIGGSEFTAEFRNTADSPMLGSMQNIKAFSTSGVGGQSNLSCYMVNQDGDIFGQGTQTIAAGPPQTNTLTNIQPLNIFNFWYTGFATDGFASATMVKFGFWLPPHWDQNIVCVPSTSTFQILPLLS